MAKVKSNLLVHGLSGMLGKQIVVRKQNDGYVVAAAPHRTAEQTAAQKQHVDLFRQASAYAKGANQVPEYVAAAKLRGISPRNVAIADFMRPPEIQSIDLSGYHGAPGQTIAIIATDDVKVKSVSVLIATDDGTTIEKGAAATVANDPTRWTYTTTAVAPSSPIKALVYATDLAGHVTEKLQTLAQSATVAPPIAAE
jgi:hypothetical protein